ncbi:DUF2490 domain-containing protein [Lacimicrobium sp. SS2-24]|uniref:DUF2490 domain-containing protein n=1 Tax=Lacimicrobium sp. SS2-24 TaxID=2005569 RepID=UPI00143C57A0|nr:DUF2490 domain-containing protein [Lacimicrobium sp. SS2-24]
MMPIFSLKSLLTMLLLITSLNANAVDQWWNALSAKTKVDDYNLGLESEQRFRDEGSAFYLHNLKLSVDRTITGNLKGGLEVRYENSEKLSGSNTEELRITPYLTHKLTLNPQWSLGSRLKVENRWRHGDHALRTRLRGKLSRKFDNFSLFGSYEYFYYLADDARFDKTRSAIGYSTSLSNNMGLELYYLYQNNTNNTAEKVIGSKFSYKF